jgi:hypothetical protein
MLKKLTAKVQQLNPILEESVNGFSRSFIIEPETQDLIVEKRFFICGFRYFRKYTL